MDPRRRQLSWPAAVLAAGVVALVGGPRASGGDGAATEKEAAYAVEGTFYDGFASIPWQASYSPDGRWLAVVEGHVNSFLAVYDARTRARVWHLRFEAQPASHTPAFTKDGESLVLVEGSDLVVRRRREKEWALERRVALGFQPAITASIRPLLLSPDERHAHLYDEGKAVRVSLTGTKPEVEVLEPHDVVSLALLGTDLALAHLTQDAARTTVLAAGTAK